MKYTKVQQGQKLKSGDLWLFGGHLRIITNSGSVFRYKNKGLRYSKNRHMRQEGVLRLIPPTVIRKYLEQGDEK